MGKIRNESIKKQRHNPLMKDISSQGGTLREHTRGKAKNQSENDAEDFIDAASSRRILQLAREQQAEIEQEDEAVNTRRTSKRSRKKKLT